MLVIPFNGASKAKANSGIAIVGSQSADSGNSLAAIGPIAGISLPL
jgi:hypothetical protein